jgi:SAM-dependent methyltransferase
LKGYEAGSYGEHLADQYDDVTAGRTPAAAEIVPVLAELARGGGGRALELGVGTGRVALPLVEAGVEVVGIDASEAMIDRLHEKPGGDALPVVVGDFADVPVDGTFGVVYVVFNTFFVLTTQEAQVRCFANVAEHLAPGGAFVIEAFVPDVARFEHGSRLGVRVDLDRVGFDLVRHDAIDQRLTVQRVDISAAGLRLDPLVLRYAWPAELDLMARLAGLELRHRWRGWDRAALTATDESHVSVWAKPG